MRTLLVLLLCLLCEAIVISAQGNNRTCTTPSGEPGTCKKIRECGILIEAIKTKDPVWIKFAKDSVCWYGENRLPIVCCGTTALITTTTTTTLPTATKPTTTNMRGSEIEETIPLKPDPSDSLANKGFCGLQNPDDRIFGGEETKLDEFPWMALIRYRNKKTKKDEGYQCSGTIINRRYILTAAHCIPTEANFPEPHQVTVGVRNHEKRTECVVVVEYEECNSPQDINIDRFIPHPYYSQRSGDNDIALFLLADEVNYNDWARPICLPPANIPVPKIGTMMYVAGWGITENRTASVRKLKVELPIVSNSVCSKALSDGRTQVRANQVCAGGVPGRDACKGDSGGPLMTTYVEERENRLQWYQEGIVSRGVDCGGKNVPGIYTRVSRYVTWIKQQIR